MHDTPELRRFVEDELLRAPMLIEQVIDQTFETLGRGPASPSDRATASQLAQALLAKRPQVVAGFVDSMRQQVEAALQGKPRSTGPSRPSGVLALLDEEEVAADVEVSHAVEAIRSIAEHELLEIQTYASALAGDMEVASDHNPFRPDVCARALWDAAQKLPVARGQHIAFMRQAATPLAKVLRRAYAAACSRLEAAGVEPATYRTMILPDGSRRQRPGDTGMFSADLNQIRIALPEAPTPAVAPADDRPASEIRHLRHVEDERHAGAAARGDQVLLDLMGRLFDAMLASSTIAADVRLLVSRLQTPAIRTALAEPHALDDYAHPVWRFIDDLAHLGQTLPGGRHPERMRHLRLAEGLVERLVAERRPGSEAFEWALGRLRAMNAHRFEQRLTSVTEEIVSLQVLEERLAGVEAPPSTLGGALDLDQLDTVPTPLIPAEGVQETDPVDDPEAWIDALQPGDWLQAFLQGRRVNALVLWTGDRRDLWLLADAATDEHWAMRRRALLTLRSEGLAGTLRVRSQVRRAAHRLLQQLSPGKPTTS